VSSLLGAPRGVTPHTFTRPSLPPVTTKWPAGSAAKVLMSSRWAWDTCWIQRAVKRTSKRVIIVLVAAPLH
jgi:hypothetical protein